MKIVPVILFVIPLLLAITLFQRLQKRHTIEPRGKIILGLALVFFLMTGIAGFIPTVSVGIVSSWGTPGLGPEALEQSEILCSGHFSSGWFSLPWTHKVKLNSDPLESPIERSTPAKRRVVQFFVDHYWKGKGPQKIDVALFEPSGLNWGDAWEIPSKKNLLLALKKDTTGSGGFQLVNQTNSWLVVENSSQRFAIAMNPRETIEAFARDELVALAADPKTRGWTVDGRDYKRFQQAAGTLGKFRAGGTAVTAALETYISNPTSPLQRKAFITLTKVDPVRAWKVGRLLYQSKVLDAQIYGFVFPEVITPEMFSKIDPKELQALFDGDPLLAKGISDAFRNMKDPRAVPWLARCLDYPNVTVQYHGMSGLYEVFGKKEGILIPFTSKFETDPEFYLAPYKAWWRMHRSAYSPAFP